MYVLRKTLLPLSDVGEIIYLVAIGLSVRVTINNFIKNMTFNDCVDCV